MREALIAFIRAVHNDPKAVPAIPLRIGFDTKEGPYLPSLAFGPIGADGGFRCSFNPGDGKEQDDLSVEDGVKRYAAALENMVDK